MLAGFRHVLAFLAFACAVPVAANAQPAPFPGAPTPLVATGEPADWIFVFKLNSGVFPTTVPIASRSCDFGGTPEAYKKFSQQYLMASAIAPALVAGPSLAGTSGSDPLGATFGAIYASPLHFVVWNDQFYRSPKIAGCGDSCGGPWGHSKGIVAWNDAGEGVVLQVTTPSWPGSREHRAPRVGDGNTLGCVDDNNVMVSQDFFSLRLTEPDLEQLLSALGNASVVTDVSNPQLVQNGGPAAVQALVSKLGVRSASTTATEVLLSTGVRLISKPSALNVPPWQLVSALLGGVDLRTATWWAKPTIPSTTRTTAIGLLEKRIGTPGAVAVATSGVWQGQVFSLKGGLATNANHGKIGVSTSGTDQFTIFGDMNQQGTLSGNCKSSQNGRGGLFFVVSDATLHQSVSDLLIGGTAP